MRDTRAAYVFAGLLVCATFSGALHALTVVPAWASCLVAVALLAKAQKEDVAAIFAGVLLGVTLPKHPPPASAIVARPVAGLGGGDIFAALDQLDVDPERVLGRRISVAGEWTPARSNVPASVSRRVMTCCAADAVAVGFDVIASRSAAIAPGAWVRVTGTLAGATAGGELRYRIVNASVRRTQLHDGDENVLGMPGHRNLRPDSSNRPGSVGQERRALNRDLFDAVGVALVQDAERLAQFFVHVGKQRVRQTKAAAEFGVRFGRIPIDPDDARAEPFELPVSIAELRRLVRSPGRKIFRIEKYDEPRAVEIAQAARCVRLIGDRVGR